MSWIKCVAGTGSEGWDARNNGLVNWSEVALYFEKDEDFFRSMRREKFNFVFSFHDNKFQAVKDFMDYVWTLTHNVDQIAIELKEYGYKASFFSTWLFKNDYTTYDTMFYWWVKDSAYRGLHYNLDDYTIFDIRLIKKDGTLQNVLKGYEVFKDKIIFENYDTTKVYITKDRKNRMVPRSELSKYEETGWVLGRYQKQVTCPHCGKVGSGANMGRYHFDNCKTIKGM